MVPDIQKVSVALTGEQISTLKAAVETGEYATTSEALRDWQHKRERRGEELAQLRRMWAQGKNSGRPQAADLVSTRAEARERLKKIAAKTA